MLKGAMLLSFFRYFFSYLGLSRHSNKPEPGLTSLPKTFCFFCEKSVDGLPYVRIKATLARDSGDGGSA